MDNELLAKDLVVGYVAAHSIPEKSDMKKVAESLIEFYQLTKAELDKSKSSAAPVPIGFSIHSASRQSLTRMNLKLDLNALPAFATQLIVRRFYALTDKSRF